MDRLTQRYEYGVCDCLRKCDDGKSDCCGQKCFQSIIDKLAAYEDNGQTPEEQAKMIAYVGNDMESNALLLAEAHNLRAELELVKAERNAAVSDLRHYPGITPCHICLNRRGDMKHCALGSRNCFKWRGVQKEKTK